MSKTPSVYTFGDSLPKGEESDLFISYTNEETPGGLLEGPYGDRKHALAELSDLKRVFGNIKNPSIIKRRDLNRMLFFPYVEFG